MIKQLKTFFEELNPKSAINETTFKVLMLNVVLSTLQLVYLMLRVKYLNDLIPLWYSKPWGDIQLSPKLYIFIIPVFSFLFILGTTGFLILLKKYYLRFSTEILLIILTASNMLLTYSVFRIIRIASVPFKPLINPALLDLVIPFLVSLLIVYLFTPKFLEFAKKHGIVTDPSVHKHPGMVLVKPSARGGGVVFAIGLVITSLLFVNITIEIFGILLFAVILALLGLADDYQNTQIRSKLKFLENPVIRLLVLVVFVIVMVVAFNIRSDFISNPLGGIIKFEEHKLLIGTSEIEPLSTIFTVLWIVWILNLLSWSNGIDGQYSGIVGITGIVIAVLAVRFLPLQPHEINLAKLAIILSGASFGLGFYTWHPSKIMWGFGAMSAGLVIASLSIMINSKIATSVTFLMVPFLDASVTFGRRVLQGKNPFRGDRGHLHHLLMERGWSVRRIATFYWVSTAIFGTIGVLSSESAAVQVALTLGGLVAFGIILLNLQSITRKQKPQLTE